MTETKDDHRERERERFFGAAKLIALITLASRVAGLARDMILARLFGVSRHTDAFYLGFTIPNLFRRLFGEGALSAAFVPVFSETSELNGREKAAALLANVLGLLGLGLAGLCIVVELILLGIYLLAPGGWDRQLLLAFSAIMMPFMVTICLLALGSAALNCVGHFAYPAAAPILLNLCIIAAAAWLSRFWHDPTSQLTVVAVSVIAAGVVQLFGLAWMLRAHNLPIVPRLRPIQPGVRRMLVLAGPMLLGLGVLQINVLGDKLIAWIFTATPDAPTWTILGHTVRKPLESGVVTWLNFAERLYQFPLGVLAIALATAVFPLFSRYAARGDRENLRASINRALRLAVFEGLPSGVGLILLAGPLVTLLFVGGEFTSTDAARTAHVVRFYGLGMWAFCTQQILLRAFYAQKDTITPLKVACSVVGLNFLLNLALIWIPAVRHGAFGLSTSITATLNVLILAYILRRRLGRLGLHELLQSIARTVLATAVMAAAVWAVGFRFAPASNALRVAAAVAAGIAAYLLTCILMRSREIRELLARPGRDHQ